ncbi:homeobox protein 5 [Anopheles stephensi]|uniref:Regulatory protein zeste n=1 Tax=Anopheles stephensi TaxID=30069 RepID=A0A182XZG7_ANOST|nr:homeobox protein 5 [Anopheles stephensi]XP_035904576.1 homeobox protein 5 [Anopheles stephensi]XP_035904577.1 homeobox protein 5 [Anopheles stephensi]
MLQSSLGQAQRFKKRERTQNWAYEEKHFLLELCRKDMHIIENKRLDSALTTLKNRAWKIIHQQFAIAFGTDRNCNRLKEQWRRMKACTRAEMLDYQQRIQRFGQEVADRKKPSQFTFEIWEFMQEAKKVCKNELMDDVDYSKMKLSLEENLPQGVSIKDCSDENDDESSSMWDKNSQNICEVQIKEDSHDELDEYDKGPAAKYPRLRGLSSTSSPFGTGSSAADAAHSRFSELLASSFANRLANSDHHHLSSTGGSGSNHNNNNNNNTASGNKLLESLDAFNRTAFGSESSLADLTAHGGAASANLSQTDLSNTLEALNLLKNRFNRMSELGHWKNAFQEAHNLSTVNHHQPPESPTAAAHSAASNHMLQSLANGANGALLHEDDHDGGAHLRTDSPLLTGRIANSGLKKLLESQHQSEHELRMQILKTELETAKLNKETAELNRQLALQKLRRGDSASNSTGDVVNHSDRRDEDDPDAMDDNTSNSTVPEGRLVVRSLSSLEAPVAPLPSSVPSSPSMSLKVAKND